MQWLRRLCICRTSTSDWWRVITDFLNCNGICGTWTFVRWPWLIWGTFWTCRHWMLVQSYTWILIYWCGSASHLMAFVKSVICLWPSFVIWLLPVHRLNYTKRSNNNSKSYTFSLWYFDKSIEYFSILPVYLTQLYLFLVVKRSHFVHMYIDLSFYLSIRE